VRPRKGKSPGFRAPGLLAARLGRGDRGTVAAMTVIMHDRSKASVLGCHGIAVLLLMVCEGRLVGRASQRGWEKGLVDLEIGPTSDPPNLEGLDRDEVKVAIRRWFRSNFEDPAENTPYDSELGDYVYIWGGPYSARDEIDDTFHDVDQQIRDEVVDELELQGWEWAPHTYRVYEEDPREGEPRASYYEEAQFQLKQIERVMDRLEPVSSLIGNNNPPEEIGAPPYSSDDKAAIEAAIGILRRPPGELAGNLTSASEAADVLKTRGERLKEFFARHGDKFVESFATQLGKRAADSLTMVLWVALSTSLIAAAMAIRAFIQEMIPSLPLF